jgi:lysozyme family protein
MTEDDILAGILEREGGYTDHPQDRGGPTHFGVTASTLGEARKLGRPATREEVHALTREEALAIYKRRYVDNPGFTEAAIPYAPLRAQVIDHGVLSGPMTAVQDLQQVLGVDVDGIFGRRTKEALQRANLPAVHVALVKARTMRLVRLVQQRPSQLVFLAGWVQRALGFLS